MTISLPSSVPRAAGRRLYYSSSKHISPTPATLNMNGSDGCSMYYHFCLLCIFRPFVCLDTDSEIRPHEICSQAAQSILALAQSYDDLFTLRRVSGLMPYFICTSGLFSLAIEDGGLCSEPVHLRLGDDAPLMAKPEPKEIENSGSVIPPHVKISAAAHARLLLGKIGSTHPAARIADRYFEKGMDA